MVDWAYLYEKWDEAPEDEKKRISALFKQKTKERLAEYFRKEPQALYVYEKATGERVTEVHVKMTVDISPHYPGEYFGSIYYDSWEVAFFGSPSTEALKRTFETPEEWIDKREELEMAGFEPADLEAELKAMPWPFNIGVPIRVYFKYPEDVTFTEGAKEQWDIYHAVYRREDLEEMEIDDLKRILQIKKLSHAGKKADLIDRILGVPAKPPEEVPPPPAPPVVPPAAPPAPPPAPPKAPPAKAPPPLVPARGIAKADEKRLLSRFEALLLQRTIAPARWRPMFEDALYDWREAFKDLPRDEAVTKAFSEVERLVGRIMELAKLPVKPPIAPPVRPPEEVPAVVPPTIVAPIVPPPVGVYREFGMPWVYRLCPACFGEGIETLVLRSPYLESRLIRLGVPTRDPLFYELCEEHKRKYGGAFEIFPRDTIEFWVGEAVAKAEIDIAVMVGMGISEDYVHHCVRIYEENREKAVQ